MTRHALKSEITGTVWKIDAQPGVALEEDQLILTLESMKMEIPLVAPESCTLIEVLVKEGDAVREGQDLALIEYT
jgi:acetyl-CoA carboxylase biotin carboxyl carrier protein